MRFRAPGRRKAPGVAAGLVGTVVVHTAVVGFLFLAVHPPEPTPPVYAVELVAAPAPTRNERLAPEALPTPPEELPAPVTPAPPEPEPEDEPEEEPAPEPTPPPAEPEEREPAPETANEAVPVPGETPSTGTDVATVKTPGLEFPYPEYLRNIMNQVYKRWGAQNRALTAEISFLILRDGSVRDIRFVRRSGNFSFDLEAQGAIEAAANAGAFGALPDGWPSDVLLVSFFFEPRQR